MGRTASAVLSTAALQRNAACLRRLAPNSKLTAMIKANAYGHGLRSVALRLEGHVDYFGVASIDEALALRKVGIRTPIIAMEGVFSSEEWPAMVAESVDVVCHDGWQLESLAQAGLPEGAVRVWIKLDTGLGRLGFTGERIPEILRWLESIPAIQQPVGWMSHFACADEPSHPLHSLQLQRFRDWTQGLPGPRSLANSGAILSDPSVHYDMIRPGLLLYGAVPPTMGLASDFGLGPVMTLRTSLIACRWMEEGASIGYGARYRCPEAMPVGVAAMGYGDGYSRHFRDGTPAVIRGYPAFVVGRVSMDMTMFDLRHVPDPRPGDEVILWGQGGVPIESVAPWADASPYDLFTGVQHRVMFHWV
jgi:alanine racemase